MLRNDLYKPWFTEDDKWGFEIIDGEFSGTVLNIEKIEFVDGEGDGNIKLDYHIIKKPEGADDLNEHNEMLIKLIDLIVNDILREAIDTYEQTRDNNSSEPDPK